MNNKIFLMTAILAFASVGALIIQPSLASAQPRSSASSDVTGTSSDTSNVKRSASTSDDNLPTVTLSCGQVIKTSVKLGSNLDCQSDGLLVGGDGITIDLNGHAINGPGPKSSKLGVSLATSSGVTLRGPGTLSGFQACVLDSGGQNDVITGITFTNCQIGTFLSGAKQTQITNNMFTGNTIAMAMHSAEGTDVNMNVMNDNSLAGVTSVNSANGNFNTNIIKGADQGMFFDAQSSKNKVSQNTILDNTGADVNNGNGLPTNINQAQFSNNMCRTSIPDGLCTVGQ